MLIYGRINRGELLLDAETRQRPEVCGGPADRQERNWERAHEGGRVSSDEEGHGAAERGIAGQSRAGSKADGSTTEQRAPHAQDVDLSELPE